jgi:hypothetical protein
VHVLHHLVGDASPARRCAVGGRRWGRSRQQSGVAAAPTSRQSTDSVVLPLSLTSASTSTTAQTRLPPPGRPASAFLQAAEAAVPARWRVGRPFANPR